MVQYKILRGGHADSKAKLVVPSGLDDLPGEGANAGDIIEYENDPKLDIRFPEKFSRIDLNVEPPVSSIEEEEEVEAVLSDKEEFEKELGKLTVNQLREKAEEEEIDVEGLNRKNELVNKISESYDWD